MKKALILVCCCLIGVLFTACGEDSNKNNNSTNGDYNNNPGSYNSTISSYPENSTIPSLVESTVSGAKSDVNSMMSKVESKMQ